MYRQAELQRVLFFGKAILDSDGPNWKEIFAAFQIVMHFQIPKCPCPCSTPSRKRQLVFNHHVGLCKGACHDRLYCNAIGAVVNQPMSPPIK